jgi:peptidyl-tRNA hydrolase
MASEFSLFKMISLGNQVRDYGLNQASVIFDRGIARILRGEFTRSHAGPHTSIEIDLGEL